MNLGQFIRQKRLEKGFTMEQLGEQIGKNKAFISRLESNKVKTLKNDVMEPLATALGVPIISLFKDFDDKGFSKVEFEQVSPKEFANEVISLLNKTSNISNQEKALVIQTLNVICSDKEK